jgi:hypothetical protein
MGSIDGDVEQHVKKFACKNNTVCLEVIDWNIQLRNSHVPYGAVVSGRLKVRGKPRAERCMGNANSSAPNKSDIVKADGSDMLAARMRSDVIEGK